VALQVLPSLIPQSAMLASVDGVFNGAAITGDVAGTTLLIGRGAGQDATASAVISDLVDAARALTNNSAPNYFQSRQDPPPLAKPESIVSPYYIRLSVLDSPGTLAKITQILADQSISEISNDVRPV